MKKAFCFLILLGLFSCSKRKDWECQCRTWGLTDTGTVHTDNIKWSTEKRANKKCNVFGMKMAGDLNNYSCNIKEK